jgi:CO/xanthine dehydrogenase FAD-binding subunit
VLRVDAPHPRGGQGQGPALPRQRDHGRRGDRLKPAPFDYAAPTSVAEAIELLGRHGDGAKALAGGQSLGPLLNLRLATPSLLVDLNPIGELDGIVEEGGVLVVGAMTRQRMLERSGEVARSCPLLAEAVRWVGHVAIRNRGTVGGSIAHADPASELPAVATALGAEVRVRGPHGERTLRADELFVMPLVTSVAPDELIVSIAFPRRAPRSGHAWVEVARRHGDFALAGVGAAVTLDARGAVRDARLGLAGVGPVPVDASAATGALAGAEPTADALEAVASQAGRLCEPPSDVHASSTYRRRLVRVLVRRALETAVARARVDAG